MKKRRLICDLETNGLYFDVTRIHLYLMKDMDTNEVFVFREKEWKPALKMLEDADLTVWHNGINYDLPVLEKIHPGFITDARIRDTLVLTRLLFSDIKESDFDLHRDNILPGKLIGSHGLKAWGYRLGELKGDFGDEVDAWEEWSQEMEDYGIQDLHVTHKLWEHVNSRINKINFSQEAILLEHRFADLATRMEYNGYPFNKGKAEKLYSYFCDERQRLTEELKKTFRPWWKAAKWEKDGAGKPKQWIIGKTETPNRTLNYKNPLKASRTEGAPFTPIELIEFNPGSRDQIADRLQRLFNWIPKNFTETGKPKVSEDILRDLVGVLDADEDGVEESESELYDRLVTSIPQAKDLADYFLIQKRIGQIAEGKNGWLKLLRNGKIHGRMNTLGAKSARVTHSNPNLSQCPAVRSPYGKEMRELWTLEELGPEWVLIGTDLSGIEIRCFADALSEYDGGEYARKVIEDDIHTVNQEAFGVPTRDNAKTALYALVYGAGDAKLGTIVNGGATAGRRIKNNFIRAVPAFRNLTQKQQRLAEKTGYIYGLDGRLLPTEAPHKVLNLNLQSAGALVAKRWAIQVEDNLYESGLVQGWDKDFCMLAFCHDELGIAIRVPEIAKYSGIYTDSNDYSMFGNDTKLISKTKEKNKLDWYLSFQRLHIAYECIKKAIKQVEHHYNFKCPLDCDVKFGKSWADVH